MKAFAFCGWSGSGKTTLIVRLIEELSRKQKKIKVLKRGESDVALQPEVKDTARFLAAGAKETIYINDFQAVRFFSGKKIEQIWTELQNEDIDYLFLEGFFPRGVPVIEVCSETEPARRYRGNNLIATVNCAHPDLGIKNFTFQDLSAIINFLEDFMSEKIFLKVNDQEISLNPFVQKIFIKTISAMIDSLDRIPEKMKKVELIINKEEE